MNLTEAVKAAGVVGAGGAGFPTHVKLSAKAECFLVNAAECEPLIETDKYLCRTFPDRVVAAAVAVAGHLGAKRTVIALKGKYHAEITALEGAISRSGAQVELFRMKTFYPAGDEQTMVQQVTGRSVPERGLPLDVGCVVDNVGPLLNIQDALEGTPVTEKYLSVVGEVKELAFVKKTVVETADAIIKAAGSDMKYKVGTMIEIPRAALTADQIAKEAEFFSFGTNDLTQMTFGFSRDDAGKFLDAYYANKIYESDPFARLDQTGVGRLVEMACKLGRQTRPDLKLGICGEHGGDPSSVEFCHNVGLDYVSCSPFRVPIARLAAAQAAIKNPRK